VAAAVEASASQGGAGYASTCQFSWLPSHAIELAAIYRSPYTIVAIRKTVPSQDSLTGPILFSSRGAAKSRRGFRAVADMAIPIPGSGNFVREMPLGRVGFHCVMAA
jgi:hypothetical protein